MVTEQTMNAILVNHENFEKEVGALLDESWAHIKDRVKEASERAMKVERSLVGELTEDEMYDMVDYLSLHNRNTYEDVHLLADAWCKENDANAVIFSLKEALDEFESLGRALGVTKKTMDSLLTEYKNARE